MRQRGRPRWGGPGYTGSAAWWERPDRDTVTELVLGWQRVQTCRDSRCLQAHVDTCIFIASVFVLITRKEHREGGTLMTQQPCAQGRAHSPGMNPGGGAGLGLGRERAGRGLQALSPGKAGWGEPVLPANTSGGQQRLQKCSRPAEPRAGGRIELSVLWSSLATGRGAPASLWCFPATWPSSLPLPGRPGAHLLSRSVCLCSGLSLSLLLLSPCPSASVLSGCLPPPSATVTQPQRSRRGYVTGTC